MKSIVDGTKRIRRLLGKQKPVATEYRLMKYVLRTECEDGELIHNIVTGQLSLLNSIESEALKKQPIEYTDAISSLVENYYLVPVCYNERKLVDDLRLILRRLYIKKGIDGYTIMTTTNCNARCFYCYQAGYTHINMNQNTIENLVKYMVQHKSDDKLHLQWFGGEPLVGIKCIDQICDELKCRGIDYTSSMISNGYLFTEDIVDKAVKKWKLKKIQITLDGTESVYNSTKSYVYKKGNPFERVIKNIGLLIKRGIYVGIRLNLDQHNVEDLHNLIAYIIKTFPERQYLSVYAHVIYENEGYAPISRNEVERRELYNQMLCLNKELAICGLAKYKMALPNLRYRSCMADNPSSVLVYPNGDLYKCEHTEKGDKFGNIESDFIDSDVIARYSTPYSKSRSYCESCKLYPNCYILENCDGIKDRNPATCEFDAEIRLLSLVYQYKKYKAGVLDVNKENDTCTV